MSKDSDSLHEYRDDPSLLRAIFASDLATRKTERRWSEALLTSRLQRLQSTDNGKDVLDQVLDGNVIGVVYEKTSKLNQKESERFFRIGFNELSCHEIAAAVVESRTLYGKESSEARTILSDSFAKLLKYYYLLHKHYSSVAITAIDNESFLRMQAIHDHGANKKKQFAKIASRLGLTSLVVKGDVFIGDGEPLAPLGLAHSHPIATSDLRYKCQICGEAAATGHRSCPVCGIIVCRTCVKESRNHDCIPDELPLAMCQYVQRICGPAAVCKMTATTQVPVMSRLMLVFPSSESTIWNKLPKSVLERVYINSAHCASTIQMQLDGVVGEAGDEALRTLLTPVSKCIEETDDECTASCKKKKKKKKKPKELVQEVEEADGVVEEQITVACQVEHEEEECVPVPQDNTDTNESADNVQSKEYCVVCMENAVEFCFVPCGHMALCSVCASLTWKECAICRASCMLVTRVRSAGVL